MTIVPADHDPLRARVDALEEVVRKLIQHLVKDGVMTTALRTEIVDSLMDTAVGNEEAEKQMRRWQEGLEG